MKQMVLALVVLATGVFALAADDDQAKKDLKALQGTWEYTRHVSNGKETPKKKFEGMTLTFKDDKWEQKKGDNLLLFGTIKLDPSKKPKAAAKKPAAKKKAAKKKPAKKMKKAKKGGKKRL